MPATYPTTITVSQNGDTTLARDIFRIVLSVIFPPLGVFLKVRFTAHFFISLLLTLMAYVPGLVHAVWVLSKRPEELWPQRY